MNKPSRYFSQTQQKKHQNKEWNQFKVNHFEDNNKETRTSLTSFWCLYYWLWNYFTDCSGVSIVDFEQVNDGGKEMLCKSAHLLPAGFRYDCNPDNHKEVNK